MNRMNRVFGLTSLLIISLVLMQTTLYASDSNSDARKDRIVGLWDVEVAIANCVTGAPMGSFLALHKFELGGTGQVVPTSSPTALSAHMMIWNHVQKDDYEMSVKFYRFSPTGTFIGWVVLTNDVSIDKSANYYSGSGVAEFFDADGIFQFASCPSLVGTRFNG